MDLVEFSVSKRALSSGISPTIGSLLRCLRSLSWARPPITKLSPLRTVAEVEASRWLMVG